jgi:hypothetical protein
LNYFYILLLLYLLLLVSFQKVKEKSKVENYWRHGRHGRLPPKYNVYKIKNKNKIGGKPPVSPTASLIYTVSK